ncbi:hypothetical protein FB446DRAFT_750642 [Lentinula raphanica]|nr:hypothetical protein FB446DRAFT_750642 [Lentinula raphanica]
MLVLTLHPINPIIKRYISIRRWWSPFPVVLEDRRPSRLPTPINTIVARYLLNLFFDLRFGCLGYTSFFSRVIVFVLTIRAKENRGLIISRSFDCLPLLDPYSAFELFVRHIREVSREPEVVDLVGYVRVLIERAWLSRIHGCGIRSIKQNENKYEVDYSGVEHSKRSLHLVGSELSYNGGSDSSSCQITAARLIRECESVSTKTACSFLSREGRFNVLGPFM